MSSSDQPKPRSAAGRKPGSLLREYLAEESEDQNRTANSQAETPGAAPAPAPPGQGTQIIKLPPKREQPAPKVEESPPPPATVSPPTQSASPGVQPVSLQPAPAQQAPQNQPVPKQQPGPPVQSHSIGYSPPSNRVQPPLSATEIQSKVAPANHPQTAATPPAAQASPEAQAKTQSQTRPAAQARQAAPLTQSTANVAATPTQAQAQAPTQNTSPSPAPATSPRAARQETDSAAKPVLLQTEGLVKIYDGRTVVDGVEINVRKGEIVGLLGPNGAGKTTSFYMIVGLVPPNAGRVFFDGADVTRLPMYKRARLGMGYLPQEESIFRKLTVEENIMAVMQTMPYSRKERRSRCDALLERFSITHIRNNIAMTCSGGEKRRLTIARSLVANPSLIMLDEPFSGVDPIAVNEIQNIVEGLREAGLAILITDHNARQTLELVDRAYLIYEGRVLREGSKDFLVNDPVSRELYLGDRFTM